MATKKPSISTKHSQIEQASTQTFIAVAAAAVVVSMALVILNILWGTAQFNSRVQSEQEITRDILNSNIAAAPKLQEEFNRLEIAAPLIPDQPSDKKNSEIVLDGLPSQFDFPELASSINNLAEASSVDLESFRGTDLGASALQSSPDPEPESIPFDIEVTGTYATVSKFLRNIERSIRPISVVDIEISGTNSKLRVSLSAETYYQPEFDLSIRRKVVE